MMTQGIQKRKSYDHRLKQQVVESGDASLIERYGGCIHSSRNWIYRGIPRHISTDDEIQPKSAIVNRLEKKIKAYSAVLVGPDVQQNHQK